MTGGKSWQLGAPGTLLYRLYDGMRRRLNRRLVSCLSEVAIKRSHSRVLEAGSGPAFGSSLFRQNERVGLAVALDIDIEALSEARRRDPELVAVIADLHNLPFPGESFDLIWNSSTLEHIDDPGQALGQMECVTRRGGFVFVGVPYVYGPLGFQRWIANTRAGIWIGSVFDRPRLEGMLRAAGLQPRRTFFYFFRCFVGLLAQKP